MAKKRRTQWEIWCDEGLEDELLSTMSTLAQLGLPKRHIASEIGVSEDTLLAWCDKYPKIKESLRRGSSHLMADAGSILIDLMHSGDIDPSLRASIASKFLSRELMKWDAVLQKESGDSDNDTDTGVTLVFKR